MRRAKWTATNEEIDLIISTEDTKKRHHEVKIKLIVSH